MGFTSRSSRLHSESSRDICPGCNIPSALRRFGGNASEFERGTSKERAGPHWRLVRGLNEASVPVGRANVPFGRSTYTPPCETAEQRQASKAHRRGRCVVVVHARSNDIGLSSSTRRLQTRDLLILSIRFTVYRLLRPASVLSCLRLKNPEVLLEGCRRRTSVQSRTAEATLTFL
jgi:hypothetical protein